MTKLLTPSLYATSRTRYSQTISADRNSPGGRLLYLDFEPRGIEELVSSSTFRNLHLPEAEMKRATWWLKRPGSDFLVQGEFLPADLDGTFVTIAGMLESIFERDRVRMTQAGFEVVELDIWYE